jgi:ATP-binding cassette subfamily B multidrug efflux pump
LSIARAVVLNPQILLFDEITANLDSLTESQVLHALQAAARDRTVLSISHRLYEASGGRMIVMNGRES